MSYAACIVLGVRNQSPVQQLQFIVVERGRGPPNTSHSHRLDIVKPTFAETAIQSHEKIDAFTFLILDPIII